MKNTDPRNTSPEFLLNEVLTFADTVMALQPGNPWTALTCGEAEQLACIFAAAGRRDVYHHIIHQHALGDEAEEVDFHVDMLDGEAPPVPLGKEATEQAEELRIMVHPEGGRESDPSPVSHAPCAQGTIDIGGVTSQFLLPLVNDSVRYSQWGASNTVLGDRVDLLDAMAGAAREWALDNLLCHICRENTVDDGEGYDGMCGDCADKSSCVADCSPDDDELDGPCSECGTDWSKWDGEDYDEFRFNQREEREQANG